MGTEEEGTTCYANLRTKYTVTYNTCHDACYAYGLLNDDKEYIDGIIEAAEWSSGYSLRYLFAILLSSDCISQPEEVWDKCWPYLSDDIQYIKRRILNNPELVISENEIKNLTMMEIEKLIRRFGKSLRDFHSMPYLDWTNASRVQNKLIVEELRYNRAVLLEEHQSLITNLNDEQRHVYDTVMNAINSERGGVLFVYGYGGTGKTYVWKTLSVAIRSKGEIVLNAASSGIASLLLLGGRTAHSRFAISLNPIENSTCAINQGSQLAELIVKSKLIIWDEAPMMRRHYFQALDRSLKDIMHLTNPLNSHKPFGGKIIIFGGDFHQILPVIPKGTRQDIVYAIIKASNIWRDCTVLRLTKNMRLQGCELDESLQDLKEFSDWIASIGDRTVGVDHDSYKDVEIPEDILLGGTYDPIATIVESTFPSNERNINEPNLLKDRAILAPTLDVVDNINEYMTSWNPEDGKVYYSSDRGCKSDANVDILGDVHTTEFLNGIKYSGVPNHELKLKIGTPIMLLRNIDHSLGLYNGTRLLITKLGHHILEAKILFGNNAGQSVLISRMSLTPSDSRLPFKFQRRQFPIIISYAMTINKSQGQSLSHVALLLRKPVFTHGQLYVAVSRVTNRKGLKILVCDKDNMLSKSTRNVVYKEFFRICNIVL